MSETKRIIYTSFDESPGRKNRTACWPLVEPSVRSFAERVGAELVNLPKPEDYQPQWVIFDAMRHSLENDTHAFWIDCDVFVQPHAPNVFELPDRFYLCQPDPTNRVHPRMRRQWVDNYKLINPRPYLVSGIGLWSPRHVGKFVEWFDKERHRFSPKDGDQELLVVAAFETETPVFYFPPGLHKMTRWVSDGTPFMHAAGKGKHRKIARFKRMSERFQRKGEAS
jgi:hypothetical protein